MAHNLYQDKLAYTGKEPWHKLGTHFESAMTAEQCIEAAGLNFSVYKEQLYRVTSDDIEKVNAFATINGDTNDVLGIVGSQYSPIQNRDSFAFFDEFIGKGLAIYETAGALGKGEKIWLLAKLPKSFSPIAGDKIEQYCMLYNTHDGSLPCSVMFTPIRVVCQNTLNVALKHCNQIVKVRHTSGADDKLKEAGRILNEMNEYFDRMAETCYSLAQYKIDDDFITDYKNALFGKEDDIPKGRGRTVRLQKLEMFDGRLRNGMGVDLPGVAGTAWHAYNAAVEMADYDLPKIGQNPTNDIIFGKSAEFKQKAHEAAFAVIAARS